jgi:transcriptional regulator with XRE-family HTH domain
MKQPELGKKISDLRKEKGLTQEELVDLCNINVRTIQRIESGEVTPRSYTLKTILKALDYQLNEIKIEAENTISATQHQIKIITCAFWMGIAYVIIDSFNLFLNIIREFDFVAIPNVTNFNLLYTNTQIAAAIGCIFFYFGFYHTGKIVSNSLLKISSIIMMVAAIANYFFSWFLLEANEFIQTVFGVIILLSLGAIGIPFGIGIYKLKNHYNQYASVTGIFTIILYATMLTVLLIFVSVFLLIPVMILQLILLYKIKENLQKR